MELPKITSAFLNLTNSCNLTCRYCFVEQKPEFMTLQTAKDAADFLAGNGQASINFFGGEPMLMWDEIIVPLTLYVHEKYGDGFQLSMTSNGTLLDRERAEFMRGNGIGLLFSMDGGRATQEHNRPMRSGASSFDALEEKIPVILEYFPGVMFRSTVTEDTAQSLYHDILYAEEKGFKEFFTMPNCFEPWTDTSTLREQLRRYSEHYIDFMRRERDPIYFSQLEKYFRKILLRNTAIQREERRVSASCAACGKCGLGAGKYAGININGDIVACQELFSHCDGFSAIGSIYTGVRDDLRVKLASEYDSAPAVGDDCASCPLDRICDGGCVANNYLLNGDVHKVPGIYCEWSRMLFGEAVYIMETLGGEENERCKARWAGYVR